MCSIYDLITTLNATKRRAKIVEYGRFYNNYFAILQRMLFPNSIIIS